MGNWNGANNVESATLEWVNWFKKTRLHSTIWYTINNLNEFLTRQGNQNLVRTCEKNSKNYAIFL